MSLRPLFSMLTILAMVGAATTDEAGSGDGEFPTDDDVNAVAKKLYCPVCPSTPLDVCETKACQDWRAQIRDQLASGWTEDQIIEYFVEQYGERVLAEPRMSGFSTLVWLSPLAALIVGLIVLRRVLNKWRVPCHPEPVESEPLPEIPPDLLWRIEAELEDLR